MLLPPHRTTRNHARATTRTAAPCAVEGLEDRRLFNATLPTATDLGTLFGQVQRADSVGAADTVDHFKVSLAHTGKLTARLTNLSANADLRLIRDANNNGVAEAAEVLAVSANGGTAQEQIIKAPLGPGAYFLQAKRVTGSPAYKLTVTSDYAGQAFASAHNLGSFVGTKQLKDRVDAEDPTDFYKVVLTSTKTLSANLTGTGDAHLELSKDLDNDGAYDDGQDFSHRSNNPGTSNEAFTFTLGPGTYFVRVFRGAADAQYALNVKVA